MNIKRENAVTYESVAASQTNQVLGANGAAGDFLKVLHINVTTPATSQVSIKDGSDSAIVIYPNASTITGSVTVAFEMVSRTGAWQITTGAGVNVIAVGAFS